MTVIAAEPTGTEERRCRVLGDRVECWRIGSVDLDRCRECVYLLRLEVAGTPASGSAVCANSNEDAEIEFAW